jgi:hypothetical protein
MSDLVISENNKGKQYSPFYFELVYVPRAHSTLGDWKFSWEVKNNTENNTENT